MDTAFYVFTGTKLLTLELIVLALGFAAGHGVGYFTAYRERRGPR